MNILDLGVVISSGLLFLLAILHEWAGIQAYIKGRTLNRFDRWKPETEKQKTLLGVFFMISAPWMFVEIINIALILGSNQFGNWLGLLNIVTKLFQLVLLFKYVSWNTLAKRLCEINIVAWLMWIVM